MSDFINSATQRISPQEYIQNEFTKDVVQQESRSVQSVMAFADEKGGLSLLLEKQSLRTDDSRALSAAQNRKGGDVEGNVTAKSVTLSSSGEGDSNKAERLAGAAASVIPAQNNITQPNNKPSESKSAVESTGNSSTASTGQIRSQAAVEGGTDITAADTVKPSFINVVGSMKQIAVSNILTTVLTEAEGTANKAAADASIRSVDAANRAGGKMIEAAQQSMNGAITSGVVGVVGQGVTTARSMKALSKESSSITNNLRPARDLELGVRQHQTEIKMGKDTMVHQGKSLSGDVEASLGRSHAGDMHTSALNRDAHNTVQLDTNKVRMTSDYANQGIRSGQGVIEGTFGVSASEKQKEAELARADRDVNNELANVQSQTAKKAAEAKAALLNTLDNALNTNSSTVSSMAERTR